MHGGAHSGRKEDVIQSQSRRGLSLSISLEVLAEEASASGAAGVGAMVLLPTQRPMRLL